MHINTSCVCCSIFSLWLTAEAIDCSESLREARLPPLQRWTHTLPWADLQRNYFKFIQWNGRQGDTVVHWFALSPHSESVGGSVAGSFCVEFACAPGVCVGSLCVLQLPFTVQKHACFRTPRPLPSLPLPPWTAAKITINPQIPNTSKHCGRCWSVLIRMTLNLGRV